MADTNRVVVTGMGALTPIGNDVPSLDAALSAGVNGVAPITAFDASGMRVSLSAELKNFQPEDYMDKKELRRMDRFNQLAIIAADEAIQSSGIDLDKTDRDRVGLYIASGIGGLNTLVAEAGKLFQRGDRGVSPLMIPMMIPNMAAGTIAIKYGLHGASMSHLTACASSTHAIGEAMRSIKHGYHDVMVVGGSESVMNKLAFSGFQNMTALSVATEPDAASLPFDKRRNGFILGEGAGILILESYAHAVKRGAKIYAEIVGYGATTDAYHITSPDPEGAGAAKAMRLAIAEAGMTPADVDYINAHGTGTPVNDKFETKAIHTVFGENTEVAVNSTKSMTGHMLGGTGAVEAIACILQMRGGYLHANINLLEQDEECALNVVKRRTDASIRMALSNSLGFGGHNASILMKSFD